MRPVRRAAAEPFPLPSVHPDGRDRQGLRGGSPAGAALRGDGARGPQIRLAGGQIRWLCAGGRVLLFMACRQQQSAVAAPVAGVCGSRAVLARSDGAAGGFVGAA